MNWFKNFFTGKKGKKDQAKSVMAKSTPASSRVSGSSYLSKPEDSNYIHDSSGDFFNPLNPLSPLSPLSPISPVSIWDDGGRSTSHPESIDTSPSYDSSPNYDHSPSYDSSSWSSSSDSSSYDSGSSYDSSSSSSDW